MHTIHKLFATPLYKTYFNREFKKEELLECNKLLEDNSQNTENLISKNKSVLENNILSDIKEFIEFNIREFAYYTLGITKKQSIYITSSWLNLNKPGMSHHRHSHPNSILSGVFYLQCVPNDRISFFNKSSSILAHILPDEQYSGRPDITADKIAVEIKERDLLIFPSDLIHQVDKNISESNRISLSFNTYLKGKMAEGVNRLIL